VLVDFVCFDDSLCLNLVLASFFSAMGPESKEESFETNCLVIKLKYTAAIVAQ